MSVSDCDCVILCGGKGERLQSVVHDVPKVMADVDGRPFMDHIIEYVAAQGIERIILCTGYKAKQVEDYYRDHSFGITIDYSTEEKPLGTGGAIKNAMEVIESDPFFVLNGDSFLKADLNALLQFHCDNKAEVTIAVSDVQEAGDFGSLSLDADGRITAFEEKSKAGPTAVNAGIYCLNQSSLGRMPQAEAFSIEREFFPGMAGGAFYGFKVNQGFMDIGTPERYASVKKKISEG